MDARTEHDRWRDRLDDSCTLVRSDDPATSTGSFRVAEVSDLQRSDSQTTYALVLEADRPHELDQGMYDVSFDDESLCGLFLVPISPTALEAVINRLVDVAEHDEVSA